MQLIQINKNWTPTWRPPRHRNREQEVMDQDFGEPYHPPEMDLDIDAPLATDPDDFPEEERIYFMVALSQLLPEPDAHADPDKRTL